MSDFLGCFLATQAGVMSYSGGEKSYPHLAIYAASFCSYNEANSVVRLAGRPIPPSAAGGQRKLSAPLNTEQGKLFI